MNTRARYDENTAIATPPGSLPPSRLPIAASIAQEFDVKPADWRVLVDQIFPSAKSVEAVVMALAYCRKRNLDIFKKPVHIVPMWSSAKRAMVETVWPGIAEIRTTASRTGDYAGIDEVEFGPIIERQFEGVVEQWEDRQKVERTVKKTVRFPEWAKVTVYRMNRGVRCAFTARVFWEEMYASVGKSGLPNDMWEKRPRGQLDKCVEAAALRKAFPEELGNIYAAEEMEGRDIDGVTIDHVSQKQPPKPPAPPAPPAAEPAADADGVVIEHDAQEGKVIDGEILPIDDGANEIDANEFFEALEAELAQATTVEDLEEAWTARDPMAVFDGDDINQGIAMAIKRRRLKEIGG